MTPRKIAIGLLILIGILILWAVFFGKKSAERSFASGFLNLRKGKGYCVKMCGSESNKACMDECKTKVGFYGCC